jgi:hypothetical protein
MKTIDHDQLPCFRADVEAAQGLPERDASQARAALRPRRREGAGRKARPQRSMPVRFREEVSSGAACTWAGFDGSERDVYWR